ncbi:dermonecrotic toxin SPH-like [Ixodes scapularis]|uniref:dermonecrotic toxin SPH-like n=1 Tax=Ixodes scapularis TaxID=6945 RepID=UPI001A9D6106|nr:dermonecrotic toxin SPH-like [Ixodes scapularis]
MVNSIHEVDRFLTRGANALEADVNFAPNGTVLETFHGFPCDCLRRCKERENIADYLEYIRHVTSIPGAKFRRKLNLLFFDLKTAEVPEESKHRAGIDLARNLIQHLWSQVSPKDMVNVLISIQHVSDNKVLRGAIETIKRWGGPLALSKIGYDVGMNDPLDQISRMYHRLGIRDHRWQGDGISNCLSVLWPMGRLRQALDFRDSAKGYVDKVYRWTVDRPVAIWRIIRRKVDGIITNRPERVLSVLQKSSVGSRVRPADIRDSPWDRIRSEKSKNDDLEQDSEQDTLGDD